MYLSLQLLYCSSLFFKDSKLFIKASCILSVFASILFLRSWIIITITTLNSFSARLSISTSLILLELYIVLLFGTYISAVSFCGKFSVFVVSVPQAARL